MLTGPDSPFSRCGCGVTTDALDGVCLSCRRWSSPTPIPPPPGGYTSAEVRGLLRAAVRPYARGKHTGLRVWCVENGIGSAYSRLYDFYHDRSDNPPATLLRVLKLERRYGPRSG